MKMNPTRWLPGTALIVFMATFSPSLLADEGMWLFNHPPRKQLKEKYGFDVTETWLDHVQKSSVRFNSGGSGSFVSEDGLVISNHHVGADALQKFGDKNKNYLRDGFYARSQAEEKRCLDLELNVLVSIEDVTTRVNAAVKPEMAVEQAFLARRAVMAEVEKESFDKTALRSDVVTLYQGGQYHLYRFKKYTDVRLVFAPEQQIAFYGGDPDNFEYPRFDLDICLFRVYEDDQPAKLQHYLKWSEAGVSENELVFVSGHPGRTSRLFTVAELEYVRDQRLPYALERLHGLEVLLASYSARSDENARRAKEDLFGVQNSRKAYIGELAGVLDPKLMEQKQAAEKKLRDAVAARPELKDAVGAWDRIAEAQKIIAENARRYNLLEVGHGFYSDLFVIARTLLRAADEKPKPNSERLREFGEAGLASLEFQLFSEKPIYDDLERQALAATFAAWKEALPSNDVVLKAALGYGNGDPEAAAARIMAQTALTDVAARRALLQGGSAAVKRSTDPLIVLARQIEPPPPPASADGLSFEQMQNEFLKLAPPPSVAPQDKGLTKRDKHAARCHYRIGSHRSRLGHGVCARGLGRRDV